MTRIEEGYLAFEFGQRWNVTKLDEHRDYRERIEKLEGTKAVDFVGILDKRDLYLIEVKDFRGHRIKNKDRLLKGKLPIEVAQKVRDSLACIIGAYHTSNEPEYWQSHVKLLCDRHRNIKVVLWLENDPLPSHRPLRQKTRASIRGKVFKRKLVWLTSHVLVCGKDRGALPDVTVNNLPRN
ncbi:hypothetical protein ACFLXQ_00685 [Chloroflexota bacterium]